MTTDYTTGRLKESHGYINIMVSDGASYSFIKVVNFYEHKMKFPDGMEYHASPQGGEFSIPFSTNFQYRFEVEENSKDWISINYHETRSEMHDGVLNVTVAMNDYEYSRLGKILVIPVEGAGIPEEIQEWMQASMEQVGRDDFTAHLPIAGHYDCYIDWGDGQAEHVTGGNEWDEHINAKISHVYNVQEPETFTVRISGTVTSLDSQGLKAPCIAEVVQCSWRSSRS